MLWATAPFATLKAYTTDTFNFMYKNVSIDDFAAYFSENSGITLDYFFDEWLKQPNHPVYANTYYVYPEVDASTVNYTINQTQLDPPFLLCLWNCCSISAMAAIL